MPHPRDIYRFQYPLKEYLTAFLWDEYFTFFYRQLQFIVSVLQWDFSWLMFLGVLLNNRWRCLYAHYLSFLVMIVPIYQIKLYLLLHIRTFSDENNLSTLKVILSSY